jgi:hypothetical protein
VAPDPEVVEKVVVVERRVPKKKKPKRTKAQRRMRKWRRKTKKFFGIQSKKVKKSAKKASAYTERTAAEAKTRGAVAYRRARSWSGRMYTRSRNGIVRFGRGLMSALGTGLGYGGRMLRFLGRGAARVVGYTGFGSSTAVKWVLRLLQGGLTIGLMGINWVSFGALKLIINEANWWRGTARMFRWLSLPAKSRPAFKPYVRAGGWKTTDSGRRRLLGLFNRVAALTFGSSVFLVETEFDMDDDEAAEYEEYAKFDLLDPWTATDDPRMNDYADLPWDKVLSRHHRRLDYVIDNNDEDEIALWSGRVYFLEKFIEDESNLSRLEPLYRAWRDKQPPPKKGGLARGKFHAGMMEERKVLREWIQKKLEAEEAAADLVTP